MSRRLFRILAVDDDESILSVIKHVLKAEYTVETARDGEMAVRRLKCSPFSLVLADLKMPGMDGIEILRRTQEIDPRIPVIIITGFGSVESAVECIKIGAFDYITKPFNIKELRMLVHKALHDKVTEESETTSFGSEIATRFGNIIGTSPRMREVFNLIEKVANSTCSVLINGASGTGKELVARAIHENSPRKENIFLPVACGALSRYILESELFGHVKGAFTGAVGSKTGLFKAADKGTIFLDEIGEIHPSSQASLLRVLQEGEVKPLGSEKAIPVDVRTVAATNRDLEKEVVRGRFRKDLYYRLRVLSISLPDLKERKEDIPLLIDHFLRKYGHQMRRGAKRISKAALAWIIRHRGLSAFGTGRRRDPVGYAIIPRGDTEINKNQYVMNCIPEIEYRSSPTTQVLYKHLHLSRFLVVCELIRFYKFWSKY